MRRQCASSDVLALSSRPPAPLQSALRSAPISCLLISLLLLLSRRAMATSLCPSPSPSSTRRSCDPAKPPPTGSQVNHQWCAHALCGMCLPLPRCVGPNDLPQAACECAESCCPAACAYLNTTNPHPLRAQVDPGSMCTHTCSAHPWVKPARAVGCPACHGQASRLLTRCTGHDPLWAPRSVCAAMCSELVLRTLI